MATGRRNMALRPGNRGAFSFPIQAFLRLRRRIGSHLLDSEQNTNYVPPSFHEEGETIMVRAVAEEALALASIALFLGMVAVWAQVLEMI
jgi:hypothetical protein